MQGCCCEKTNKNAIGKQGQFSVNYIDAAMTQIIKQCCKAHHFDAAPALGKNDDGALSLARLLPFSKASQLFENKQMLTL
jgi:hypothetical protein